MTTILKVYEIIDYINRYINTNEMINNTMKFKYFKYDNLLDVISNGLNGTIENNIILIKNYDISIMNINNDIYLVEIIDNTLVEPTGPI